MSTMLFRRKSCLVSNTRWAGIRACRVLQLTSSAEFVLYVIRCRYRFLRLTSWFKVPKIPFPKEAFEYRRNRAERL